MKKVRKMCVNSVLTSVLALSALWLAGCSQDEFPVDRPPVIGEKGTLSFVLPVGQNQMVTYAGVTGKNEEYELHNIRIYWFSDKDTLFQVFGWGDGTTAGGMNNPLPDPLPITLTPAPNNTTTVTIWTGENNNFPSKFFIVANVNGDTVNMVKSKALKEVRVGITSVDDFKTFLSDALDDTGGDLELLGTPIPMSLSKSVGDSPNGYVVVQDPSQDGIVNDIHLKRRVARFDIINTADFSNFEITNVIVSNARKKGWLNDSIFSPANSYASLTGKFKVEAKAQADDADAFNGPKSTNPKVDFEVGGSLYDEREHHTKAAFYLYPTQMDSLNTNGMTEIVLEGMYNKSTPRLYSLNLPDTGALNILANNVYRIHVIPTEEKELQFKLEVIHWDAADTVPANRPVKSVASWGSLSSSANPALDVDIATAGEINVSYEFSTSDRNPDTLRFTTKGDNVLISQNPDEQHVTHVAFLPSGTGFNEADYQAVANAKVISTTNLTYGATYETTHEVVLPPTDAPIEVIMKIMNAIDTKNFITVKLKSNNYAKTGYKPVKVGNILWAPVNVGAVIKPSMTDTYAANAHGDSITGNLFQWGRNVAFKASTGAATGAVAGPLSAEAAAATGSFITHATDWLTPANDSLWGVGTTTVDKAKMQGPCPPGWRVPTKADFDALIASSALGQNVTNVALWRVTSNNPVDTLYFPYGGTLVSGTGALNSTQYGSGGTSKTALLWTATINTADGTAKRPWRIAPQVAFNQSYFFSVSEQRSNAMAIRAVRDIPTP
jgi:uncharacterized protein (TIGR02145 family)